MRIARRLWASALMASVMVAAGCAKRARQAPAAEANPEREVRLLVQRDPALKPLLYSATRQLFDSLRSGGRPIGFYGVYINRERQISLTNDVLSLPEVQAAARKNLPAGCEPTLSVPPISRAPAPTDPAAPRTVPTTTRGPTAAPPVLAPTTNARFCGTAADDSYSYHAFRIAGDSAYIETQRAGAARTATLCMHLVVDQLLGGWKLVRVTPSKVNACGR